MAKKEKKSKKSKKEKKSKKSKKEKKPKAGGGEKKSSAAPTAPPNHSLPLGVGTTWTPEDDFLTGQIFERFSKGRGMMTAAECVEAIRSMGIGSNNNTFSPPPPTNCETPRPAQRQNRQQRRPSETVRSNGDDSVFQARHMQMSPWWLPNDTLHGGNYYQGADLAFAEARRRREFADRATEEMRANRFGD
jgi:hypothetical protein